MIEPPRCIYEGCPAHRPMVLSSETAEYVTWVCETCWAVRAQSKPHGQQKAKYEADLSKYRKRVQAVREHESRPRYFI